MEVVELKEMQEVTGGFISLATLGALAAIVGVGVALLIAYGAFIYIKYKKQLKKLGIIK